MGRKLGGLCSSGEGELHNKMWPGTRPIYLHAKFHLDPSNRLATIHQRHRQDRQTDRQTDRPTHRQRSDSIGRTAFTARRNARIASAALAVAIPSVCLSVRPYVRLSVTRRYCVKTTARSTVQFALPDSKMCLVLLKPKIFPRDDPLIPPEILAPDDLPQLIVASLDTFCLVAPLP